MAHRQGGLIALTLGLLVAAQVLPGFRVTPASDAHVAIAGAPSSAQHAAIASSYGQLPLSFELNAGQTDPAVRFLTHGSGYSLFLTPNAAVMSLGGGTAAPARDAALRLPGMPTLPAKPQPIIVVGMQWLHANPNPVVTGEETLPGTINYFIGNDPAKWRTNIPTYQQVRYYNIYPGIDLVYYGNQGQLEYDFVVAPGADPASIALGFTGTRQVGVDLLGNLSLTLPSGALQQAKPLIYQSVNGARHTVAGGYALAGDGRVGFALGRYNPHVPLVIDPAYKFSTYLGGTGDENAYGIAVDAAGNAYLTGQTNSNNYPTAYPEQGTYAGGGEDAFVTKMNAAGTALMYSTYLGGSNYEYGEGIAVDSSGNTFVTGTTQANQFPQVNAMLGTCQPNFNVFVTKINSTGSALLFSTCFGNCTVYCFGGGITVDSSNSVYLTGSTSGGTPLVNALQPTYGGYFHDAFVSKINNSGTAIFYSTYLGGSGDEFGQGIAVDSAGNVYVDGMTTSTDFPLANALQSIYGGGTVQEGDAFISELNASGSAFVFSTYLGGSGPDGASAIAVDGAGNIYVTGRTGSTDFPTHNPLQSNYGGAGDDAFVAELITSGSALVYSTYLGGSGVDTGSDIAVDSHGNAYVTGQTASTNFPVANALQTYLGGTGATNAFVSELNSGGSALLYSSYLGGSFSDSGAAIALNTGREVYIAGQTASSNFPSANAFQPTFGGGSGHSYSGDVFVTKIITLPSVDTTTGVFRPSNGVLYLKNANTTGPADISLNYGLPGDQPITGDWTGKGYRSIGIFRNGDFYLRNSNTSGYADLTVAFGQAGDLPVAGDWTGKGYDSIGVYRPSTSTFYLRDSNTTGAPDHTVRLGLSGDVPIVGDWTGKGWDSVGVFRPSNGIVYLRNSNTTGYADIAFTYGIAGDKPVVGDWTAQGKDTIGVDRAGNFLLRTSNSTGPATISFYLGVNGDDPIAGPWLAPASSPPPVHRGSGGSSAPSHTSTTRAGASAVTPRGRYAMP